MNRQVGGTSRSRRSGPRNNKATRIAESAQPGQTGWRPPPILTPPHISHRAMIRRAVHAEWRRHGCRHRCCLHQRSGRAQARSTGQAHKLKAQLPPYAAALRYRASWRSGFGGAGGHPGTCGPQVSILQCRMQFELPSRTSGVNGAESSAAVGARVGSWLAASSSLAPAWPPALLPLFRSVMPLAAPVCAGPACFAREWPSLPPPPLLRSPRLQLQHPSPTPSPCCCRFPCSRSCCCLLTHPLPQLRPLPLLLGPTQPCRGGPRQ